MFVIKVHSWAERPTARGRFGFYDQPLNWEKEMTTTKLY